MSRHLFLVVAGGVLLLGRSGFGQVVYDLESPACGTTILGEAGETIQVTITATAESNLREIHDLQMSIDVSGEGVTVLRDPCDDLCFTRRFFPEAPNAFLGSENGNLQHEPVDPDLAPVGGPLARRPQGAGYAVFVDFPSVIFPLPAGSYRVVEFSVDVVVPQESSGVDVTVSYVDVLRLDPLGYYFGNAWNATTVSPEFVTERGSCSFRVATATPVLVFRRGDVNGDGKVDVSDPISNLSAQFLGQGVPDYPGCRDAADTNDDGMVDVSDPITSLSHQFLGNPTELAAPFRDCGLDPTADNRDGDDTSGEEEDELGCEMYPAPSADRQCD